MISNPLYNLTKGLKIVQFWGAGIFRIVLLLYKGDSKAIVCLILDLLKK